MTTALTLPAPGTSAEWVLHACLLAQIDDVHAPVWGLDSAELDVAAELLSQMEQAASGGSDATATVCAQALAYAVHEIDHLLMSEAQVSAGHRLLSQMAVRWGR